MSDALVTDLYEVNRIVVSGGYGIDDLVAAGAPVDTFAVGTKVGTWADAQYLDSAYKVVEYAGRPVMKLSADKVTAPSPQIFRRRDEAGAVALRDDELRQALGRTSTTPSR